MRIYEIVTEYEKDKYYITHDRFRVMCETFAEALEEATKRIRSKKVMIASIEIVADTQL